MKQYKIGDIAKLLGLTPQALRFYEQEGVIVPEKSENGTRYFTTAEVIRLLAFKKYRLSEFSVQDVAVHFKQGSLNDLTARLNRQSDRLIAQSELLLRRARAIRGFERMLREAQADEGRIVRMKNPQIYLQGITFDQLNSLSQEQREAFMLLANALPESSMYFTCPICGDGEPVFRFGVTEETAANWAIPLDDMHAVQPGDCVRIYVRTPGHPWDADRLHRLVQRVHEAGFEPDRSRRIIGKHLASETVEKVIYLYAAIWIPICS